MAEPSPGVGLTAGDQGTKGETLKEGPLALYRGFLGLYNGYIRIIWGIRIRGPF